MSLIGGMREVLDSLKLFNCAVRGMSQRVLTFLSQGSDSLESLFIADLGFSSKEEALLYLDSVVSDSLSFVESFAVSDRRVSGSKGSFEISQKSGVFSHYKYFFYVTLDLDSGSINTPSWGFGFGCHSIRGRDYSTAPFELRKRLGDVDQRGVYFPSGYLVKLFGLCHLSDNEYYYTPSIPLKSLYIYPHIVLRTIEAFEYSQVGLSYSSYGFLFRCFPFDKIFQYISHFSHELCCYPPLSHFCIDEVRMEKLADEKYCIRVCLGFCVGDSVVDSFLSSFPFRDRDLLDVNTVIQELKYYADYVIKDHLPSLFKDTKCVLYMQQYDRPFFPLKASRSTRLLWNLQIAFTIELDYLESGRV